LRVPNLVVNPLESKQCFESVLLTAFLFIAKRYAAQHNVIGLCHTQR